MLLERIWMKKMCGICKIVAIMKKIMKLFVLVAAAAMALASCQKNEIPAPEKQDVHFTINAGIKTRTSIVESADKDENDKPIYHAQWDGNEELGVLFAAPNKDTNEENVVTLANAVSGEVASFQGNVTLDATSGTFYAFYPAEAFKRGYGEGDARLDLKNEQKPTATSFDPLCDILVAKPYDYEVVDGKVVADGLEFARLMSVLRIDLKSEFVDIQNEFVESVSFTAGDVEITGYARVFLDNPKFDKWASNGAQWCTVTANYDSDLVSINGTSNSVYLVIAPVTIPADKDLTFEIKTKNYNISKTAKSPEMKFTAGKVSKINLTIEADNCDKIDTSIDYSGEWLITGVKETQTYAVSAYVAGNNLDVLVPITVADEKITEVDGLAACKMVITKVSTEGYAGMYTIEDASSTEEKRSYLYAAGTGTNNYLKASSTLSAGSYWDITKNDNGTYTIIASKHSTERNTIWFNTGNDIFSCYQSNATSYKPITLYPYSMVVPDTTPSISLIKNSDQVTYDATSYDFTYKTKNITGKVAVAIKEGATMTIVSASASDGTVTVKFDENADAQQKTAIIELSYEGAASQEFELTQAGKPAEGAPTEVVDVLTRATTGVANNGGYSTWSGKTAQSSAVYAGQSAGGNDAIQLRTTNNNSGIVTTTSGGYVRKIIVEWQSATQSGRILDVYGKNSAYTEATDLYDTNKQGTKLGSIKCGTSTELVITGDYQYIGLRSSGSAMYLTEIDITWETSGSGGDVTPDPDPEQPGEGGGETPDPEGNTFTKYTGELTEGDYIIVYENVAMNTTVEGERLKYTSVSPTGDVIYDPAESIVWHIAKNGSYWTIYNAGVNKYAASTGVKNKAQMLGSGTDDKSLWTVSGTSTYEFVNKYNKARNVNSNLRRNGTYGFACYSTSTGGALTLYKKN